MGVKSVESEVVFALYSNHILLGDDEVVILPHLTDGAVAAPHHYLIGDHNLEPDSLAVAPSLVEFLLLGCINFLGHLIILLYSACFG